MQEDGGEICLQAWGWYPDLESCVRSFHSDSCWFTPWFLTLLLIYTACVEKATSGGTPSARPAREGQLPETIVMQTTHIFLGMVSKLRSRTLLQMCTHKTRCQSIKNSALLALGSARWEPHSPHPIHTSPALYCTLPAQARTPVTCFLLPFSLVFLSILLQPWPVTSLHFDIACPYFMICMSLFLG